MMKLPKMEICGKCLSTFKSEEKYLDHQCAATGFTPRDPEHLGPEFTAISNAALARGNKRVELEAKGVTPEKAVGLTREIGKVAK